MKQRRCFSVIAGLVTTTLVCQAQSSANVPSPTPYSIVARNADSQTWEKTTYSVSTSGQLIPSLHRVKEIRTGLNYLDGHTWRPSVPAFHLSTDGQYVFADKVQSKVKLLANLAASNSVSITTPDGIALNTAPSAIGLYDAASGKSLIIAQIANCSGLLVSSNQVLYQNAFDGVSADIIYTLKCDSFSQDVVLKQDIDPADYGLPAKTTRIQIFTRFFNPPAPDQITRPLYVEKNQTIRSQMADPDFVDHTLEFGQLRFGHGHAFSTPSSNKFAAASVAKDFKTINGQSYLVESLEYPSIQNDLKSLPRVAPSSVTRARSATAIHDDYVTLLLPHPTTKTTMSVKEPAFAEAAMPKGLVIDYVALGGTEPEPMVFQGDTTYFVSGSVDCDDVVLEGGTVIKYPNDTGAYIEVDGNLTCETASYRPAIFTAVDDDTVGESMNGTPGSGYTGSIQSGGYANPALYIPNYSLSINNARFAYAQIAVEANAGNNEISGTLTDCQLIDCVQGISWSSGSGTTISMNNCLVANAGCLLLDNGDAGDPGSDGDNNGYLNNCTVDNSTLGVNNAQYFYGSDSINAYNCVFSSVTVDGGGTNTFTAYGGINGFYNCTSFGSNPLTDNNDPYRPVGAGSYYLADNTFREKGQIDGLSELATKTTWPPIVYVGTNISGLGTLLPAVPRDTNSSPDLGYHYDPLDYAFAGCDLYSTNLFFAAGTAVGWFETNGSVGPGQPYGISLSGGANMAFNGYASQPCIFARYTMVQEDVNGNWTGDGWMGAIMFNGGSPVPQLSANFTKVTSDDWNGNLFRDNWTSGAGDFENCEFYNFHIATYDMTSLSFNNCLFYRFNQTFWSSPNLTFDNCTFYNGGMFLGRSSPVTWSIENCAFDGTAFDWDDTYNGTSYTTINYNAYNTNNLSWKTYPILRSTNHGTNEVIGKYDVMVTNYNWETSWFGDFYLPTNSPLIQAGSTNAIDLGLYWFTTQTNQTINGTNTVDIGYHYVATDAHGHRLPILFGTTYGGGYYDNGTVFAILNGGGENILYKFVLNGGPNDAALPVGELVLSGNTLYGVTAGGGSGTYGGGTVYKINTDGSGYKVLYNFGATGTDGVEPFAGLVLSGDTLYGTTVSGGANGEGTVFKINTDGSGYQPLYSFGAEYSGDGNSPGALTLSGNTLYGTTITGGVYYNGFYFAGGGTIFSIGTSGSGYHILHSFGSGLNDALFPNAKLLVINNMVYGTTECGGAYQVYAGSPSGTAFSYNVLSGGFNVLHSFDSTPTDGYLLLGGLTLSGNTLYGTTQCGGANGRNKSNGGTDGDGILFSVGTSGAGYNIVENFSANSLYGNGPEYAELLLFGNSLIGTTLGDGSYGCGNVFSINTHGSGAADIYDFTGYNIMGFPNGDGEGPMGGVCSP